jgi:hypothetical protein
VNEGDGVDERLRAEAYVCLAAHVGLISEGFEATTTELKTRAEKVWTGLVKTRSWGKGDGIVSGKGNRRECIPDTSARRS